MSEWQDCLQIIDLPECTIVVLALK